MLHVLGDCECLQSLETRELWFNLQQAHSAEFWVNLGGELFSCPQGPFHLIYDQSHCEASTVMRSFFQREVAPQLLSSPADTQGTLT